MSQNPTKQILVTCCADCPFNMKCSAWDKLSKRDTIFLNIANSVPQDFMLTKCPLDNAELPQGVI